MKSKTGGLDKYSDAFMFGNEVNFLVCCHHVMSILGIDPLVLRSLQDRVMDNRMDMLCEQNPLICGQISESDVLVTRGAVGVGKRHMERYPRKRHGSHLSVPHRSCDEGEV